MKWEGNRESDNVEDRRSGGGGGGRGGGLGGLIGGRGIGVGTIVIALLGGWMFGINPLTILGLLSGGGAPTEQVQQQAPARKPPADDRMAKFVSTVLAETGGKGVEVVFDSVGQAVWDQSLKCLAYNGRYVMIGFASNKQVADEPFVVPRRFMLSNIRLCGVMLNYAEPAMAGFLKSAMGWNIASREVGERAHAAVLDLIERGEVRPLVGEVIGFDQIPERIEAMGERGTTGRVIAMVDR